ncbi:MAG TPA: glycosyltransferase family A protein [Syntrophorhabdales bacterium]|nr:glycosyltransferase family A protein [Syntrophorhabdales bacterium]
MSRVSVIIPCFNDGTYIDETVDSVLAQTYQDFEIIIVNDGSTDPRTNDILSNYSRPNTRVIQTTNQGASNARNRAIEEARGEFMLPLDADDKIGTEYLEEAVKVLDGDPDVGIVYCLAEFFGDKKGLWELPPYSLEQMLVGNLIFCSALFRKTDWLKVNGYNPNMRYGFEDWDLWLSIIELKRRVLQIPEVLFFYRVRNVSRTTLMTEDRILDMRVQLFRNHQQLYTDNIRSLLEQIVKTELIFQNLDHAYYEVINSKTWRLTEPLRRLASVFQRKSQLPSDR